MSIPVLGGIVAVSLASTAAQASLVNAVGEALHPVSIIAGAGALGYNAYSEYQLRNRLKNELSSTVPTKTQTITGRRKRDRGSLGSRHLVLFSNRRLVRRKWGRRGV